MRIEQLEDISSSWDTFIQEQAQDGGLLQSSVWAAFQESFGYIPLYFQITKDAQVQAQVVIFLSSLPFGWHSLYIPRGPVIKRGADVKEVYTLIFEKIQKISKKKKILYVDIDPLEIEETVFHQNKFHVLPHPRQPQETLILDVTQSEESLLAHMKPKTRYNIGLAQKLGVQIHIDQTEEGKLSFLHLVEQTAKRHSFIAHKRKYYEKMIDILGKQNALRIYTALYQNKVIAAHAVVYFGDTAIYLHGASLYEFRDKMAPHLLQFHQMMDAKKQGFKHYDFWGIATQGIKKSSWAGITRFKLGFQKKASMTVYPNGYRKVMNSPVYFIYTILQKLKKVF